MACGWMVRLVGAKALMGLLCGIMLGGVTHAQGTDELARLRSEVSRLHGQGKYADAIQVAERYVALARQRHGEEHTEFAAALAWLGFAYQAQGRYPEAEPLYRRSLAVTEKALGPEHPDVGASLNNLASLYKAQGRYAEAEPLYRRSLAVTEKALGPEHPSVGTSLNNLAGLYRAQGRYAEAADYWRRSTRVIKRRAERGLSGDTEGSAKGEPQRASWQFAGPHSLPVGTLPAGVALGRLLRRHREADHGGR